ncbi:MAG TPA: DUF805 domain-containing protein [Cytophagaceae bacterium]|jgi:uncharacterized membrane protein YhaH (DUF805 family)|nr:DUF805 domain-containing protein [Cytophagaceae bacterium]
MFKAPFSFNGRIRRTEYVITFFIYVIMAFIINTSVEMYPFLILIYIPLLWILWAQGAKRCHDLNKNGWYQIIPLFFLVLIFSRGDNGPNKYDDGHDASIPDVLDA